MQRQQIGGRGIAVVLAAALIAAALSSIGLALLFPLGEERNTCAVFISILLLLPFCILGNLLIGLPAFITIAKLGLIWWMIWIPASVAMGFFLEFIIGGVHGWNSRDLRITVPLSLICAITYRLIWTTSEHWRSRK